MELRDRIDKIIHKATKKLPHLQVYLHSSLLSEPFVYSPKGELQPFHSASVGKLATAFAVIRFIEKKELNWTTPIHTFFDISFLENLFVLQGVDYATDVTIVHLLGHTSGVNDYFEGITNDKSSILDQVLNDPNHFYTPLELIEFTSKKQNAVGKPGDKYLYSDTGFLLLALLLEKIAKKPFYQILREEVFIPLGLKNTGLLFYDPIALQDKLAPVIVKKQDVRLHQSLSIDFSGGGLFTTLEDLSRLVNGLTNRDFIEESSYLAMSQFNHYFTSGMYYGLGLMELRFEKLFFLLKGLPRLHGHLGVLGVHAWINPQTKDTFVINVSNMSQMAASFRVLIQIVVELNKEYAKKKW